jgi:uncharacterized protein YqeY
MNTVSTKSNLENALKDALRAGDETRKRTLRMALAAIKNAEIDRGSQDEDAQMALLQKEIKSRHEAIEDARRANRPDLEEANLAEISILREFLPQPLTDVELEDLARQAIAEVRASGMNDLGKVMKVLTPRLQGRATGQQASLIVRKLLTP